MDNQNLIRMANRIGDFFEHMPDRQAAEADIAKHIKAFWPPRMRREILEVLDSEPEALKDIVREAVKAHREQLTPA